MNGGGVILYNTEDGRAQLRLEVVDGTVWLSQAGMAELFQTSPQNITQHIRTIHGDGELDREATCKDFLQVQTEGERPVQRKITVYRLEMILAVGYRVRSPRGVQFRRWASTVLRDYLVKGFALDDRRLKEPAEGWDYFDELLERVREIRASEKRFYQKIRDLFTTAVDYDRTAETARRFFQTIQNKMLWAVTGHTAAELIMERADPAKANMGLTAWSGGKVRKADVAIAKNYLAEAEAKELDLLVSAFLDLAADRARRRQQTTMAEWIGFTDQYLKLADRSVLSHAGGVSHDRMLKTIDERYATFDTARRTDERRTAELEHEQEIDEQLRQIEAAAHRPRRRGEPA